MHSYHLIGPFDTFTPQIETQATSLVTMIGCPGDMNAPETHSKDEQVEISWLLPDSFFEPIDKVQVQVGLPDGRFTDL